MASAFVAEAVITGAVLSTFTSNDVPALLLALSLAVPETLVPVEGVSALTTTSAGQLATPERASLQVKCTVTLWFVHDPAVYEVPSAFVAEAEITGAVLSTFTRNDVVLPLPALSVAVADTTVPASGVSALTTASAGQLARPESASPQVKWTVTDWFVHVPAA